MMYFDGIFGHISQFLNPDLDPDLDHLRGGPSHGDNTCKKIKVNRTDSFSYAPRQTYIDTQTQMYYPRTPLQEQG